MSRAQPRPAEKLQVRRTRKLLREALVELIEERGFERLSVSEITERAMVSRAAFYRHYTDKYQLVEQLFDEAMNALRETAASAALPPPDPLASWTRFFEHIDAYQRLYGALLGRKGSPWFAARMRSALAQLVAEHFEGAEDDFVPSVLAAMALQSITWWLEHDRPCPPDEIAARSSRLAAAVIAASASSGTRALAANGGRDLRSSHGAQRI